MGYSPQQKLLHVANQLGITDMKNMQGTTRVLYHSQNAATGPGASLPNITFFGDTLNNAQFISETNVPVGSKLQVNEAMLIEKVVFHGVSINGATNAPKANQYIRTTSNAQTCDIIFSVYVGNKRVLKDVRTTLDPFFMDGAAYTGYASFGFFLEGAGIVIPPQVEFRVEAKLVDLYQSSNVTALNASNPNLMCSLYGTGVLLNLNTSL